jgi:hypothetical protein
MKTLACALLVVVTVGLGLSALAAEDKAPPKAALDLAPSLAALGKDPAIVAAVKAQNAKGQTVEQAKEVNKKWKATQGLDDFMKSQINNPVADKLREIMKSKPYFAEAFLMDKNGSNVAIGAKTSSYWRGEMPKFVEAYKGGKGATYVAPVSFDESSQTYSTQVSVPVMDGKTAIGVLVLGLDVAKLPK